MTKKITELAAAAATNGTEVVPIVQGGVTVKARTDALIPSGTYVQPFTTPVAGATAVRQGYLDIREKGAKVDGVTDDSQAVLDAANALPPYSGGYGSSGLFFPPGITQIGSAASLAALIKSGVAIKGAGEQSSVIRGSIAGPIIGSHNPAAVTDPVNLYPSIEDIYIINQSANVAARALLLDLCSNLTLRRVHAQTAAVGANSSAVRMRGSILFNSYDSTYSGVGSDWAFDMDGLGAACNVVAFNGSTFTNSKSGLRAINGTTLSLLGGNHFEALLGGNTQPGCIVIDSWQGISVDGNYAESCVCSFMVVYNAINQSYGFMIGTNFLTNLASPFFDLTNAKYGFVGSQVMIPGANAPNANGIFTGGSATEMTFAKQRLASGTGAALGTPAASAVVLGSSADAGLYKIAQAVPAAGVIDVQNIPATYRHLLVEAVVRAETAGVVDNVNLSLNNDAVDANYDSVVVQGVGAAVSASEAMGGASSRFVSACPGAGSPASQFAVVRIVIPNYSVATQNKTYRAESDSWESRGSGGMRLRRYSKGWNNTAAINRLTLAANGGNLATGSSMSVYGIKPGA